MKKLTYLSFKEAVNISKKIAVSTKHTEYISIENALLRVINEDIKCVKNMPSFDNSAMDGFAIKHKDLGKKIAINKTIFAGEIPSISLNADECYKIMTGAIVPSDADTIVPFEMCKSIDDDFVELPDKIEKGFSLRRKGEESSIGDTLIKKSTILTQNSISLLASQGITNIRVYKKITIAVVSTGNELKEPWQNASENEIYNSNTYSIISCLKAYNFDATYIGVVPDSLEDTISFIDGLKSFDVIITTGGISMGEADFVAEAYAKNGLKVAFHGVKVKPGKPTMMGTMGDTYVMAMPGNPLTAMVNLSILSIPVLFKLQGSVECEYDFVYAKSKTTFDLAKGKSNIVLGELSGGEFEAFNDNRYGSGMITPLAYSNAFAIFLENKTTVKKDDIIKVIKFNDKTTDRVVDIFN
jgi:molybdopterin molybdotransferase